MNEAPTIITLTTDFGYKDPFIAEMKGVILSINPSASIVDITHNIEYFNINEAAFIIGYSYKYFPPGTIHVVVVDPGVGSERRPLIIKVGGHSFVGPDNGVFSFILREDRAIECVEIANDKYILRKKSSTFQGRDIFAPVAAWLSRGIDMAEVGLQFTAPTTISIPMRRRIKEGLMGEILYIDQFGNAITNMTEEDLQQIGSKYQIDIKGHSIYPVMYYAQVADGGLGCLINSSGYLEIFSYRNNASRLLEIKRGDIVVVSSESD